VPSAGGYIRKYSRKQNGVTTNIKYRELVTYVSLRLEDSENFQTLSIKYKIIAFRIRLSKLWMLDIAVFMDMWPCILVESMHINEAQIHDRVAVNL